MATSLRELLPVDELAMPRGKSWGDQFAASAHVPAYSRARAGKVGTGVLQWIGALPARWNAFMSKKTELADLRVYLEHEGDIYCSVSLAVRRTSQTRSGEYEVYVENFHDVLRGKDSVHSTGRHIARTTIVDREMYEWKVRVAQISRLTRISGIAFGSARRGSGQPNFAQSGASGKSARTRIAATIPMPKFQHGYEVFAVPVSATATIDRLRDTVPYPQSTIAAVLVADWISPAIVLVVWAATDPSAYMATESHRADTASRRFVASPAAYRGTWVQTEIGAPDDDVLVHGFQHGVWPPHQSVDPADYSFVRDGAGEVDRVVITGQITQAEADAMLAARGLL